MGLTNFLNYELCKFTSTSQLDETKPILCGLHLYNLTHTHIISQSIKGSSSVPDPPWMCLRTVFLNWSSDLQTSTV